MKAAQARRERQNCGFPTLFRLTLFDKGTSIKALNLKTIFYSEKQKKKAAEPHQNTPSSSLQSLICMTWFANHSAAVSWKEQTQDTVQE